MAYYREKSNSTVILKMHILEDQVVEFLTANKAGLGFLGEQGGESIHKKFNKLGKDVCLANSLQRLRAMMKEHHRQTFPANIAAAPKSKKRFLKEE